jgi:hypothetical protein
MTKSRANCWARTSRLSPDGAYAFSVIESTSDLGAMLKLTPSSHQISRRCVYYTAASQPETHCHEKCLKYVSIKTLASCRGGNTLKIVDVEMLLEAVLKGNPTNAPRGFCPNGSPDVDDKRCKSESRRGDGI